MSVTFIYLFIPRPFLGLAFAAPSGGHLHVLPVQTSAIRGPELKKDLKLVMVDITCW